MSDDNVIPLHGCTDQTNVITLPQLADIIRSSEADEDALAAAAIDRAILQDKKIDQLTEFLDREFGQGDWLLSAEDTIALTVCQWLVGRLNDRFAVIQLLVDATSVVTLGEDQSGDAAA